MTTPLFSVNGAAELLERDRRSVQKSLRHVQPDKMERGQPRWKLKTILQALDQLPNAARNKRDVGPVILHDWLVPANWRDSRIVASIVEFNEALAALQAIEAIDQRRAFVITKLAPLIAFHNKNFRDWETDNPAPGKFANDNTSVSCRVDCLWTQQREAVEAACGWTYEECWKILNDAADEEEE